MPTTSDVSTELPYPKSHIQQYVSQKYSNRSTHPYHSAHKIKEILSQQSNFRSEQKKKKLVKCDNKGIKASEKKTEKPINPRIVRNFRNWKNQWSVCSVCYRKENRRNMKSVSIEADRLVLMISCILRGEYSFGEAEFYISRKNTVLACHSHFVEAKEEIYKCLQSKNLEDVVLCSDDLMNNLMVIVNRLRPCTIFSFRNDLKYFFLRNRQLISTFVPYQVEPNDQKSKCGLGEGIQTEAEHLPEEHRKGPEEDRGFIWSRK